MNSEMVSIKIEKKWKKWKKWKSKKKNPKLLGPYRNSSSLADRHHEAQ